MDETLSEAKEGEKASSSSVETELDEATEMVEEVGRKLTFF